MQRNMAIGLLNTAVLSSKHVVRIPFSSGAFLLFVSFPRKITMCFDDGRALACVDCTGRRVNLGTAEPAMVNWDVACLCCL